MQRKLLPLSAIKPSPLAQAITKELDRGVTLFPARGAYSGNNKEVVYCVVYRHETRRLRELIHSMDPGAFIIIGDVHDVIGEGFKQTVKQKVG